MPDKPTDPQLGPALALVALRREHPELPPVSWTIPESGHLTAYLYDLAAWDAHREVLGGRVERPLRYEQRGEPRVSQHLYATWRDIEVTLIGIYDAAVYDAAHAEAVAAA